tara:strand:- start:50592 stop:51212 length:621 start_codon:yes stop_codon:yes gene_type:complete
MKRILFTALLLIGSSAFAVNMGSIVKAQIVLGQVTQVVDKYKEIQGLLDSGAITLDYEEPIEGNTGKFLLPFDGGGNPTPWADKALNAQIGALAAEKATDTAISAAVSKVPFGGFMAGAAKDKAKGAGAIVAIGGWDYIKETSSLSFDRLDDYSIYMHQEFNGLPGYEKALAAAMAVYPKLEKSHKRYIDKAYQKARKQARALNRD